MEGMRIYLRTLKTLYIKTQIAIATIKDEVGVNPTNFIDARAPGSSNPLATVTELKTFNRRLSPYINCPAPLCSALPCPSATTIVPQTIKRSCRFVTSFSRVSSINRRRARRSFSSSPSVSFHPSPMNSVTDGLCCAVAFSMPR